MQQLSQACQAGNLDACYRFEQLRNQQATNAILLYGAGPPMVNNQITYWPRMQ